MLNSAGHHVEEPVYPSRSNEYEEEQRRVFASTQRAPQVEASVRSRSLHRTRGSGLRGQFAYQQSDWKRWNAYQQSDWNAQQRSVS